MVESLCQGMSSALLFGSKLIYRLRNEEMRTILDLCVSLQSRSRLYSDINGDTLQEGMEQRIKAGQSALLFYVYQDIVELMSILASNYDENDRAILDLCKSALVKVGQEIMIKI